MKNELSKDKYLALALVILLLAAYVITRDTVMQTLLITAVGGFLGLVRSGGTTNISSEGAPGVAGDLNQDATRSVK